MEHITVTEVLESDLYTLVQISRQTFYDTFSVDNTAENIQSYIATTFSLPALKKELLNTHSKFYFAVYNGIIAGYVKINYTEAQTELTDVNAVEVERIYVLQQYQGRQIGKLLLHKAIQEAMAAKAPFIWLGVWEHNVKAISFYKKFGFIPFDKHVFMLGKDEQIDVMLKLPLR